MFQHINTWYSNSLPKGYSLTCEPIYNHIYDTRIRFELNDIIFLDSTYFNTRCGGQEINQYLLSNFPETKNALNHFFTQPPNYCGYWGYFAQNGYNNSHYVLTSGSMFSDWWVVWDSHIHHIAHEYGHAVGLHHTYNSEYRCISHYDFLDDVFGLCAEPSCSNNCFTEMDCTGDHICYLTNTCFYNTATPPFPLMSGNNNSPRYISPKSAGRMHRALTLYGSSFRINNRNMHKYVKEKTSAGIPKTIASNEIWDFPIKMYQDILILEGNTLTIKCEVLMPINGKIIVEPGALLVIDGGIITSAHDSPWRGIYVVGDRTKPQTFENQGAVIMENGAVIENSLYGVALRAFDDAWHTNGGIIQATNSTFRNNWRNVEFMNYKNTNDQGQEIPTISYFTNCNFITDEQTLHNVHWGNVTIWDVNGVNFTGCNFVDERQNLDFQAYRQARDGIYTISAGFSVKNCNFDGLKYGIHSSTEVPNRTFSVNNSSFSTYRGIFFNAIDNAFIVGNTFNIAPGYTYAGQRCADTYGIYIDNSSMFTVENNVLSSSSTGNTTCGSLGLIARNTGIFQNEIYRNTFSNFTIGIEAIGKNRGENLGSGLQIKCNIFYDNAYDIFVVPGTQSKPEGIRQLQGYAGSPSTSTLAGNLFGNNSPILISNFVNQCANISYFHHNVQSEPRVKPAIYSSKIFFYESPDLFYNHEASCPAKTRSESYPELLAEKQNAHSLFETTSQQLQDMVDQGNTEMTTQQVEMANTGNAWYTYQSLMQTSPYLSDQVLTALGAKEEGFNKAMIRDVMLINPQTAKSEAVQEALDARADQLPAYMRWQIDNGLFHFGQKEIAEQFMAYQKTRHDQALNQIIQGIVHERAGFGNAPAVEALLALTNDIRYQYLLAELQFSKSDFTTGNQLLSQIEQSFDITHEEAWQAHQDYLDFYSLLAQWPHADYPGYSGLPEEALQQLEGYLEATPRVAGKALSLLMLNHAIEYEEPILYPSEEVAAMSAPILPPAPFLAPGESESELKSALFPSPAKEYITLSWCLETDREIKGNIEFRDARGLLVFTMPVHQACDQQNLPLSGWKSGAYTATISLGAGFRKSISFVVSR